MMVLIILFCCLVFVGVYTTGKVLFWQISFNTLVVPFTIIPDVWSMQTLEKMTQRPYRSKQRLEGNL